MMNAKTPAERQTVMEEQRESMQAGMGMMHQMPGGDMMGGMGGSMMAQKGKPADMTTQMQMMQEKRMDMMQMMMQSMIDRARHDGRAQRRQVSRFTDIHRCAAAYMRGVVKFRRIRRARSSAHRCR